MKTIAELKQSIQGSEILKFKIDQREAKIVGEIYVVDEQLDLISLLKPLVAQKIQLNLKIIKLESKLNQLKNDYPSIQIQNHQQINYDQINSELQELITKQREIRSQIERKSTLLQGTKNKITSMESKIREQEDKIKDITLQ